MRDSWSSWLTEFFRLFGIGIRVGEKKNFRLPRPLLPTNLKSLNLATWFFMTAVELRNSAQGFSSLPAFIVTTVPSGTSPRAITLKAVGKVLLDLQCVGNAEHRKYGLPVRTNSPGGYSA